MESANLTVQDLTIMVQFIDISTKRGAVDGSELATVGTLRNKLVAVINQAEAHERAQADKEKVAEVSDDVDKTVSSD